MDYSLLVFQNFLALILAFPQQIQYGADVSLSLGSAPESGHSYSENTNAGIVAPLSGLVDTFNDQIGQAVKSKSINFVPPFPESGRKTAILESSAKESIPIQADIKYGNLQNFVAGFVNPKPIVDTIEEHEKYGNDGDKFRQFGTLVVGGFEGLSNGLNALVELPFQTFKQVSKKITTSLNQVGGKLVGLA